MPTKINVVSNKKPEVEVKELSIGTWFSAEISDTTDMNPVKRRATFVRTDQYSSKGKDSILCVMMYDPKDVRHIGHLHPINGSTPVKVYDEANINLVLDGGLS